MSGRTDRQNPAGEKNLVYHVMLAFVPSRCFPGNCGAERERGWSVLSSPERYSPAVNLGLVSQRDVTQSGHGGTLSPASPREQFAAIVATPGSA